VIETRLCFGLGVQGSCLAERLWRRKGRSGPHMGEAGSRAAEDDW